MTYESLYENIKDTEVPTFQTTGLEFGISVAPWTRSFGEKFTSMSSQFDLCNR